MLLAVGVFALMDAGLKLLAPHYPAAQVAALRGAASLPFVLAWLALTEGFRSLLRVRWPLHLPQHPRHVAATLHAVDNDLLRSIQDHVPQSDHFKSRIMHQCAGEKCHQRRSGTPFSMQAVVVASEARVRKQHVNLRALLQNSLRLEPA